MSLYPGLARKCVRDNPDVEMPTAIGCPGVSGMQVRLILYKKIIRGKGLLEAFANQSDTLYRHGNTLRKGLTTTLS